MKAFQNNEFEKYKAEAEEKWGNTEAYCQYNKKTGNFSKEKQNALAEDMNRIMAEFSECMKNGEEPVSDKVQVLVKCLQNHITESYYDCTDEILAGLGQMYVADERFRNNIDSHATGTAAFISEAIKRYCSR